VASKSFRPTLLFLARSANATATVAPQQQQQQLHTSKVSATVIKG